MKWRTLELRASIAAHWIVLALVFCGCANVAVAQSWRQVEIPADWKRPDFDGMVEYRCRVAVPLAWRDRELSIFLEASDDARQCWINGQRVAEMGGMPPEYRSGLGATGRFEVPSEPIRFGANNDVLIRVYRRGSRDNFNLAAPALFAEDQAIHLSGTWWRLAESVDPTTIDLADAAAIDPPEEEQLEQTVFAGLKTADEVQAVLQRLADESGPLSPRDALAQISTAAGLQVDLVLSDPIIGQPLSMKWDARGRLWVSEYLQYPDPAGLKMVSRDRYLRTVYDKVPPPPPNHFVGRDRISIHEDSDGDGVYDKHSVFVDGLNLSTSFAIGRGGVFVLNPPYLLFYPDGDGDDVPDGDPEVLLEGFGLEDSHSIANSLRWGPDGWLYGAQGSTVTGNIRRYGTDDPVQHSMGQLIWRYHPETREYEIFAEGGGNAFGLEIDKAGRVYSGHNGGDTRGFHYVQGGYYQKSFGKHGSLSNPYAFGYFPWMKHHSVPRFSHTFVIYEGGSLPEEFHGRLFGVEPLQSRVVMSDVFPDGSTFRTQDVGYAMESADVWCRPVDIQIGPDGAIYVADFYEQRIDHSSHYQGRVHRDSGRIYRLRGETRREARKLNGLENDALVDALSDENRWVRQTALRLLVDRDAEEVVPGLIELLTDDTPSDDDVGALWALYQLGQINNELLNAGLTHESPQVRKWSVRFAAESGRTNRPTGTERLTDLFAFAQREQHPEVRSQLACSARTMDQSSGLSVISGMVQRPEDFRDPHLPLLYWWALESQAEQRRDHIVSFVSGRRWSHYPEARDFLLPRIMRRFASTGKVADLETCATLLLAIDGDESAASALLAGFDEAFQGRLIGELPESLVQQMSKYRGLSNEMKMQLGDRSVLPEVHDSLKNEQATDTDKIRNMRLLARLADPSSVDPLWAMILGDESEDVKQNALHALQSFGAQEDLGRRVIDAYSELPDNLRPSAGSLLASRLEWSRELISAVADGRISTDIVEASTVDKMRLHDDDDLQAAINDRWGSNTKIDAAALEQQINKYREQLGRGSGNPYTGRTLFNVHCGKCHTLFDQGGDIGPDLTPYQRSDEYGMLVNVLNPSLEIREGYETVAVFTLDGIAVSGFVAEETPSTVVLKQSDGQTVILEKGDIEEMQGIAQSVMPDGLLDELKPQQIRDLFAYLRATQPLP